MSLITTTQELLAFVARNDGIDYMTVDTEFMRERTYWPQLCLIQVGTETEAVAIDPLAEGIDLSPLYEMMYDEKIVKVFHAARQDLEIFHHATGEVPKPLFDTQIAAMVCGFGDSVGYDALARKLAGAVVDKGGRFTDWAQRPLTDKQLTYALGDVTHLRVIYRKLKERIHKTGRLHWLREELDIIGDPHTYENRPDEAWIRLKPRSDKRRMLGVLREVAAWRETEAQAKNVPRNRVVKDETLLDIAAQMPKDAATLSKTRGLPRGYADGRNGAALLDAVQRGLALPEVELPESKRRRELPHNLGPVVEMLKVLLKLCGDDNDVAPRLIASTSDLQDLAADDDADIPALKGWRREVFGNDALALKRGELAMRVKGRKIVVVPIDQD